MSTADEPLLSGLVTAKALVTAGELPYRDPVSAQRFLETLGVPFIIICQQRHYRREDIRRSIEQHTQRVLAPA